MGAAEHNRAVMDFFDGLGRTPGLLDLWRVGGDADDVRAKLLYEVGDDLFFNISVKDDHFIASPFAHRGQIGQPKMGVVRVSMGRRNLGLINATRTVAHSLPQWPTTFSHRWTQIEYGNRILATQRPVSADPKVLFLPNFITLRDGHKINMKPLIKIQ